MKSELSSYLERRYMKYLPKLKYLKKKQRSCNDQNVAGFESLGFHPIIQTI